MDLSCATVGETLGKWLNHLENLFLFGNEDTDGVNLESLGGFTVKGFKSSQIFRQRSYHLKTQPPPNNLQYREHGGVRKMADVLLTSLIDKEEDG